MRIDAVYLVAPKPKPPSIPTRRAFLIAGVTFVAGTTLGGACGYAMGSSKAASAADASGPVADPDLAPTGDADLDELRRWAKGPIDKLMEQHILFANLVRGTYPTDRTLWTGIGRIGEAILNGHKIDNRTVSAIWVAQVIENGDQMFAAPLLKTATALRQVR